MRLLCSAVCLSVAPENLLEHRTLARRMSAPGLTSEAQLRYLIQWFSEFSELQREDFLPVLAAASHGKADQLAASLASLTCQDKPISLFQCRIKLFNEWYPTWNEEEKSRLLKEVTDIDAEFGEKLQDAQKNGLHLNGDTNGTDEVSSSDIQEEEITGVMTNGDSVTNDEQVQTVPDSIPVEIAAAS